jgi:methylated-DNA-protein-cysteine methyltransferase related protein
VCTYGGVARMAGYPGAARQVVWALHSHPAAQVPWHRVVGAKGRILLTGESALEQRLRLQAEGIGFRGVRVDLEAHEWKAATNEGRRQKRRKSRPKVR